MAAFLTSAAERASPPFSSRVWAIFSTLDPRVLQFKPGILLKPEVAEELLDRVEVSIGQARGDALGRGRSVA